MRTHKIGFKEFVSGEYKYKQSKNKAVYATIMTATGVYMTVLVPRSALAATNTTSGSMNFDDLYNSLMGLFDGAVIIMIMFCGCVWAFGNRGAAIERLIGVGAGYLLARKAVVIKNWLGGM
jgi:TrbC/VIRB2 pilin